MTNHLSDIDLAIRASTNRSMYEAHSNIISRILAKEPGVGLAELNTSTKFVAHSALRLLRVVTSIGQTVYTPDGPLVVATIEGDTYTLTGDGGRYELGWHVGEAAEVDPIRMERWSTKGREFHGYIHPTSRRLVQSG